jgi:hypothetical protein
MSTKGPCQNTKNDKTSGENRPQIYVAVKQVPGRDEYGQHMTKEEGFHFEEQKVQVPRKFD